MDSGKIHAIEFEKSIVGKAIPYSTGRDSKKLGSFTSETILTNRKYVVTSLTFRPRVFSKRRIQFDGAIFFDGNMLSTRFVC